MKPNINFQQRHKLKKRSSEGSFYITELFKARSALCYLLVKSTHKCIANPKMVVIPQGLSWGNACRTPPKLLAL